MKNSQRNSEILAALSNTQRRRILYHLREVDSAPKDEIADRLIAWKRDSLRDGVLDEAIERVEVELHHKHLPELEDAGLIEYDRRSEKVLVRDLPELAEKCLGQLELADLSS